MNRIEMIKEQLSDCRPEKWEKIPDIDLYMDQVIGYMSRQHIGLSMDDEETLTSAMINNYIKSGTLPRAKGKRYSREHIADLTAICLLKQVLSVGETGELLKSQMEAKDVQTFYEEYVQILDGEFRRIAEDLPDKSSREEKSDAALRLAIASYGQMLACKQILQQLKEEE